jgi:sugar lactone lactonase YvrE
MAMTATTHVLRTFAAVSLLAGAAVGGAVLVRPAAGDEPAPAARPAADVAPLAAGTAFSTAFGSPLPIEGLTADRAGNLFVAARGATGAACPISRVPAGGGAAQTVGFLPAPCGPAGLAFNQQGRLFVGDGAKIEVLTPDAAAPPTATVFTDQVAGANGLAFDRRGNLWVSDGGTGAGRVWRITPDGQPTIAFRTQPMVNEVNLVDGVGGIGRDPRSLPPGKVTVTPNGRAAADTAGSQHIVANGLAFTADGGTLYVADTARGAIWKVRISRDGAVASPTGCDTTFTPDTLCLSDVLVAHPALEGADGIALDVAGNIWVAANERNALAAVSPRGDVAKVTEVFRNAPDATTKLRNGGPLEFPTSPFLAGRRLCVTSSDGSRRDNFPSTGGEATPTGPTVAKISCATALRIPGLPLPIR